MGGALLDFLVSMNSLQDHLPKVLSMSLGSMSAGACLYMCERVSQVSSYSRDECRKYLEKQRQVCMFVDEEQIERINLEFQKLGARGVTLVAASGDGGSHFSFQPFDDFGVGGELNKASCFYNLPTYPASSPYVIGVGGTTWDSSDTDGASFATPTSWSGSGGGFSMQFEAADFQKTALENYFKAANGKLPGSDQYNTTGAGYPDMASVSWDIPLAIYEGVSNSGGTSASAPATAGIFSLLNDYRLQKGLPQLGFALPRIYELAAEHQDEMFHDITEGDTSNQCDNGFPAAKGWDPQTGWGSPKWDGWVKYLGSD